MELFSDIFNYDDFIAEVKKAAERIKDPSDNDSIYKEARLLVNSFMMDRIRALGELFEKQQVMSKKEIMKIGREEFYKRKEVDEITKMITNLIKSIL